MVHLVEGRIGFDRGDAARAHEADVLGARDLEVACAARAQCEAGPTARESTCRRRPDRDGSLRSGAGGSLMIN